ncbi:MAG: hypothetical protein ACQCXQ_03050 [Verrucomicrobiales bacterium]
MTWFLALGVMLGLQGRVLAADACEVMRTHAHEHSDHDHDHEKPCDSSHEKDCPLDGHQHGTCGHAMPLATDKPDSTRVGMAWFSRHLIEEEALAAPEEPYAALDKPPLN